MLRISITWHSRLWTMLGATSERLALDMTLLPTHLFHLFSCQYVQGPELDVRNRSMLGAVCVLKGFTLEGDLDAQPIAVGQTERGKCQDKDKDVPRCCENNPAVPSNTKHRVTV